MELIEGNKIPDKILENVLALRENMSPDRETFEEETSAFSIPSIKIVYGTTQDAAKPYEARIGEMFTTAGEYVGKEKRIIVLFQNYTHTRWPAGAAASSAPICRSPDGKVAINGLICADCPHLPFRDGEKTECNKSVEFLVTDEDFSQIYRITFSKTNFKVGSKLRSLAKAAWNKVFVLSTREETGKQGKYPVYDIAMSSDEIAPETFEVVKAFAADLRVHRHQQAATIRERAERARDLGAAQSLSPEEAGTASEGAVDVEVEKEAPKKGKAAKTEDPEVGFEGGM